ncbi:hypothetical protein H2509_20605, partial [Stappia sp. F7233]|nr:hypothetical protein [Stappia albiluteola]MBA5779539.1 hypothetical protein [Stappia albiluteola]
MSSYRIGLATVTNGSASVAIAGAELTKGANARVGDLFTRDWSAFYEIAAIGGDEALTLDRPYAGATATGVTYAILKVSVARHTAAAVLEQVGALATATASVLSVSGDDKLLSLDKAEAAGAAGLLLQRGGAHRFRLGLFGSDDLKIQRSPSGSGNDYVDVLSIAQATGALTLTGVTLANPAVTGAALFAAGSA